MAENEVPFTQKKVDETWKERAAKEKEVLIGAPRPSAAPESRRAPAASSRPFLNLLTSLGYQAMIHLGEVPHPETGEREVSLEGAKEAIDLLIALKEKTETNRSAEENEIFQTVLPELQLKFSQKS